jgi:flagellar hook assembly protein FlgD
MVRMTVIDALGRDYGELFSGQQTPGRHAVQWDGRGESGTRLPSGAYFVLIDIGLSQEMKQVILLR